MTNKGSHFGPGRPHKQWGVLGERSKREKIKKLATQHHEALSLASARSANAADEKNNAYIFKLTLFKMVNALTDTKSTQSCNVCNAKPSEIK